MVFIGSRYACFLAMCSLGAGVLSAADQPLSTAPDASSAVAFSLIVEDEPHNRPSDLKPEEFAVVDDAHEQKAVDLKLAPGFQRQLSILIDSASDDAVRLAADFVANADLSDLQVAIWDASQLQLNQPATSDRAALTAALAKLRGSEKLPADNSGEAVIRNAADYVQNEQARPWMGLLFALAEQQGTPPGRKEVLYFVSNEDQSGATREQLTALVSNAAHAELSIYVVESRLLSVSAEAQAAKMAAGKNRQKDQKKAASSGAENDTVTQNVLRELAQKTGGLYAIARTKAATELLHSVTADLVTSYEIRYLPGNASKFDGRFRDVRVKCLRPQLKVRAPAGYVSAPAISFVDLRPFEPSLFSYLQAEKGDSAFPLDCQAMQFGRKNGKVHTEVVVQLPLRGMQAEEDEAGNSRLHFSILALVRREDGQIVKRLGQDVLFEESKDKPNLYTFARAVWLEPGNYQVIVVARDQNSERTSSKTIPVTLGASASGMQLADILLVRGAESATAAPADDDPLMYGSARIVPFASAHINLGKGSALPVLLTFDPGASSTPWELELEIHRDNASLGTLPLMTSVDNFGRQRALVMLEQPSLPPGHYTFVARATSGDQVFEQRREVDLLAADAASEDAADEGVPEPVKPVLALDQPELLASTNTAADQELARVLDAASKRAAEYKRSLPNFSCVETTQQYFAKVSVAPVWKVKNTFSELLRYASGAEDYQTIEVNGDRQTTARSKLPGLRVNGEFGELLTGIYSKEAAAEFHLKGKARIDGTEVYAVEYSVPRARSFYMLSTLDGATSVQCAFHGIVYIDARDFSTRYISISAQDIPLNAQYKESVLFVKYDYISFDGRQFLLPKRASISVRVGKTKLMKDDIQFRDYRRYHATVKLVFQ